MESQSAAVTISAEQIYNQIAKLVGTKYAIAEMDLRICELKQSIEQSFSQTQDMILLKQDIELRKGRIRRLKQEIENKKQVIAKQSQVTLQRREQYQEQLTQFQESKRVLQQQQAKLSEQQKNLVPHLKEQLTVLEGRTKQRQRTIAKQLQVIYPITMNPKGNFFTINGLSVYKGYIIGLKTHYISFPFVILRDQLGGDEDTASALGYAAHCIKILSKLYQIPLKFQVFTLASRSFVRDEGNDQNQKVLYVMRVALLNSYQWNN